MTYTASLRRALRRPPAARARAGFTLLEILIALTVMVLIAGAIAPMASTMMRRKQRMHTHEELQVFTEAVPEFFRDMDRLPANLTELSESPTGSPPPNWHGPYVPVGVADRISGKPDHVVDGWSRDYVLAPTGDVLAITSLGADGAAGTADDLAVQVDVTPVRREQTLERLAVVNHAIQGFYRAYGGVSSLPADYATAYGDLVAAGLLPSDTDFLRDAWGDTYTGDPAGVAPLVRAKSIHLGP